MTGLPIYLNPDEDPYTIAIKTRLNDLTLKVSIATNIAKKCFEEAAQTDNIKRENVFKRAAKYSTLSRAHLERLYVTPGLSPNSNFKTYIGRQSTVMRPKYNTLIRNLLYQKYVIQNSIPTYAYLMSELDAEYGKNYNTLVSNLNIDGFCCKRLPTVNKFIIIEDPDKVVERMTYLKRVLKCREDGRNIVYVDHHEIAYNGNETLALIAASPQLGVLAQFYLNKTLATDTDVEQFLIDITRQVLPPSSIIIMKDNLKRNLCHVPSVNSTKKQMIEWLDQHHIPFDANVHRAELNELIEKFKKNCCGKGNEFRLEDAFNKFGHQLLRQPKTIDCSYFEDFFNMIRTEPPVTLQAFVDNIDIDTWRTYEHNLNEVEHEIYMKDIQMENVIDSIFTLAKYAKLSESKFDEIECKNHEIPADIVIE